MSELVKFQCKPGQAVRKKPASFMALKEDAIKWEECGIGFIVLESESEKQPENEPEKQLVSVPAIDVVLVPELSESESENENPEPEAEIENAEKKEEIKEDSKFFFSKKRRVKNNA